MNILLSRTDRIGDLVLSTPAIATVRRSFPDARIVMVCSPYNRVVMERSVDIDDLVDLPDGAKPGAFGARYRGKIDLAVALAPRLQDIALAGATRAAVRVGYTYVRRYVARLTARFFLNRVMLSEADPDLSERDPHRHVRHEVNQLLDLVELAGAHQRVLDLRLNVTDEDRSSIAYLPSSPIVLHLGQRWFQDGSTLDSTLALMSELHRFGAPLVVTYAPECEQYAARIAESRSADMLLGGLPFYRWAAVFERARVIVTVDTGATHVASAVRRPTVVAFEHRYFRLNSQEWAPYGVPNVLVQKPADESEQSLARFRGEILAGVASLIEHA
ncbi:MAG TPA: glycosyltransferase family 9 protein [Candidatus Baltobacteraceae bacterium]|jgi:ADP-heptose:LPS heptosyltransferase|nr:glycosyltransferase family 9 protein [Candidatus Baltobacteraceae bacterium]